MGCIFIITPFFYIEFVILFRKKERFSPQNFDHFYFLLPPLLLPSPPYSTEVFGAVLRERHMG